LTNFVTISKAEIKITNFTYYGKGVDVTCKKDVPNGNSLPLVSFGSDTAGNYGHFILCPNGTYSFVDSSNQSTSQGSDDEITQIIIAVDSPFLCEGSDGNEYEATMYSIYNGDYNLNIASLFETKTKVFTGVISVKLKDSQDVARDIFFE